MELANDLSSRLPDTQRGLPLLPRYGCIFKREARCLQPGYTILAPGYQDAVDRLVDRLKQYDAGQAAPKPGDQMPPFALPNEDGHIVTLDDLLSEGPLAMTFHRGHWCPYCRINTRALAEVQAQLAADGAQLAAIMPDREQYAGAFKAEAQASYPVLSDIDNGYALFLNLAIWVGEEMQQISEIRRSALT